MLIESHYPISTMLQSHQPSQNGDTRISQIVSQVLQYIKNIFLKICCCSKKPPLPVQNIPAAPIAQPQVVPIVLSEEQQNAINFMDLDTVNQNIVEHPNWVQEARDGVLQQDLPEARLADLRQRLQVADLRLAALHARAARLLTVDINTAIEIAGMELRPAEQAIAQFEEFNQRHVGSQENLDNRFVMIRLLRERIAQRPLTPDQIGAIREMDFDEVTQNIANHSATLSEARAAIQQQNILPPELRDAQLLARFQLRLDTANARLRAIQEHRETFHIHVDELPPLTLVQVNELKAIWVSIVHNRREELRELIGEARRFAQKEINLGLAALLRIQERLDTIGQEPVNDALDYLPSLVVPVRDAPQEAQGAIPKNFRDNIDGWDLDQVTQRIAGHDAWVEQAQAHLQLPPEERDPNLLALYQLRIEFADRVLAEMHARVDALRRVQVPQVVLDELQGLDMGQVNAKIAELERFVHHRFGQLRLQEGHGRRFAQKDIDQAYAVLRVLKERRAALNQ